jgi:(p)ppGpp synthase/HD superfamily hydrolase
LLAATLTDHLGYWAPAVYAAAHVAKKLHQGQKDKGGNDYFASHLLKVGKASHTWKRQIVGFLHDAEEDTGHDVETVLRMVEEQLHEWGEHLNYKIPKSYVICTPMASAICTSFFVSSAVLH